MLRNLEIIFNTTYTDILIRRCQAHGKHINFHIGNSHKTLQLSLNNDSEYKGGKLIYLSQGNIEIPIRMAGTINIHDNTIVHGVSRLLDGVRYGLFFLKAA